MKILFYVIFCLAVLVSHLSFSSTSFADVSSAEQTSDQGSAGDGITWQDPDTVATSSSQESE